ncbi:hypothetical protein MTR67_024318 [Solanum verrucosum]|uniref:TF-B3 domain-containing protein n=1 Tax=Solanum verrucosum TaxID=315347 RepID=A0AAF0QYS8_SOLVR|nr:hypothetical protein MTR67_024318 [Solanum verrucosum]
MRIQFFAMFMCILPYWNLERARGLVNGNGVCGYLSDIIEKNGTKKYEDKNFTFRKLRNDDYTTSIVKLIKNRKLGVGDEIGYIVFYSLEVYPSLVSSMSEHRPLLSLTKTFFHNFFPSKAEEEACTVNNTPHVVTRELVEIRDVYPAPRIDLQNPWQIRKKITHDEIVVGMLMIPFFEMFEYILRYWTLDMAKSLEDGFSVWVDMWDVTEGNVPKKYEGGRVWIRKLYNDDFSIWCNELFNDRKLGDGDEIGIYWDPRSASLVFKLLSQVGS